MSLWDHKSSIIVLTIYTFDFRTFYGAQSTREILPKFISRCGYSLRAGGHMRYLAGGSYGMMGLVDATECPPTYGARKNKDLHINVSTTLDFRYQ